MRKPGRRTRKARALQAWESKRGRAKWGWLVRRSPVWTTRTATKIKPVDMEREEGTCYVLAHIKFMGRTYSTRGA